MSKRYMAGFLGVVASIITLVAALFQDIFPDADGITKFYVVFLILILSLFLFLVQLLVQAKKEKILKVALLGKIACGKTFFIAVLFEFLQEFQGEGVEIFPFGEDTIEKIKYYSNTLRSRELFDGTQPLHGYDEAHKNELKFEAKAIKKYSLRKRRYYLNVFDSSGESFQGMANSIHTNTFFLNHVLNSDVVFLLLDIDSIFSGYSDYYDFDRDLAMYISAIQILAENSGKLKSKTPLALILTKSDRLINYGIKEEDVLNKISKLLKVIEKRFVKYNVFFVSAIEITKPGSTENEPSGFRYNVKPIEIEKPLLWSLT